MKIVILHGEHTLKSYERLQKYLSVAKRKSWEVSVVADDKENLREVLVGESLFTKDRLVVIEDTKLLTSDFLKWLKKNSDGISTNLVIYHKGVMHQRTIKALPKVEKVEEFKLTKLIWSFLDSFFPGNAKNVYKLFHEAIKTDPPEFIFAMLVRHIRDIYWAKVDARSMEYPPWRIGKLKGLAAKFEKDKLVKLIDELSVADIKAKTSQMELTDSLDFIIATHLE